MENEDNQKIRIKIGSAEFEAEGPTKLVQAQFDAFMKAVEKMPQNPSEQPKSGNQGGAVPPPPPGGEASLAPLTPDVLERVFHDNGEFISLSATPTGDDAKANSLLMLLYGFNKMKGKAKVTGVMLMKAMRQSGVIIGRVDRFMDTNKEYVLQGGARKGKRYSLNNKGVKYVEELIREVLQE